MKKFTLTAFALVCALQSVNAQSVLPQLKNADMVVRHQEPTLGKENERPIIHGRRNGWKRREE